MDDRLGNITVSALVGTGAATLGFALFGLAGVGSNLRAADAARPSTPPVVIQDLSQSLRQERRSPKWDGKGALPGSAGATTPSPSPSPQPQPQQEL